MMMGLLQQSLLEVSLVVFASRSSSAGSCSEPSLVSENLN